MANLTWYGVHLDQHTLDRLRSTRPDGVAERAWVRYALSLGALLIQFGPDRILRLLGVEVPRPAPRARAREEG